MSRLIHLIALTALVTAFSGCGGGGGSSSLGPGGRTAEVSLFATDSFRDDYDQVWATIHMVELVDTEGNPQPVFADDAGRVLELRSLRDNGGERFELLAQGRIREARYSKVRLALAEVLSVVPRGMDSAQELRISDEIQRDAAGHAVIEFPLNAPRSFAGPGGNLVVDFDLANFVVSGGRLRPALREVVSQLLPNGERHERNHFRGIVTELASTGDSQTFLLQLPGGLLLPVVTSPATIIYLSDGGTSPELANGQRVTVEGAFHFGTRKFVASDVHITPLSHDGHQRALVVGVPLRADAASGRFTVRITRVEGFVPQTRELTIHVLNETVFHDRFGLVITREQFFEQLLQHDLVKATGIYHHETNTFTAYHARLMSHDIEPHRVRAVGKPVEISAANRSFLLNPLYEWEGFLPVAPHVKVATTGETRFLLRSGESVSAERFFELLPLAARVRVEGVFNRETNTITAALVRILEGHDAPQHVSAAGAPEAIDSEHGRFDIHPVAEHSGFDLVGGLVHVQTTDRTVFKGRDGAILTARQFFELLSSADRVRVEGTYDRATNTITAAVAVIGGGHAMVIAVGKPVEIAIDRRLFWIHPLVEWSGFEPRDGGVRVITTEATVFKNGEGHVITAADFFHLLREAPRVRVEGAYNREDNTITAANAQIRAI